MPRAIPPPPLDEARNELDRALAENEAAVADGHIPPYGAGAIDVLRRRVEAAARAQREPFDVAS